MPQAIDLQHSSLSVARTIMRSADFSNLLDDKQVTHGVNRGCRPLNTMIAQRNEDSPQQVVSTIAQAFLIWGRGKVDILKTDI